MWWCDDWLTAPESLQLTILEQNKYMYLLTRTERDDMVTLFLFKKLSCNFSLPLSCSFPFPSLLSCVIPNIWHINNLVACTRLQACWPIIHRPLPSLLPSCFVILPEITAHNPRLFITIDLTRSGCPASAHTTAEWERNRKRTHQRKSTSNYMWHGFRVKEPEWKYSHSTAK